jgi:ABC-type transporter Mla MlaB component
VAAAGESPNPPASASATPSTHGKVICEAAGLTNPDLTTIDALARLQLAARRNGCSFELRNPPDQLLELLRLAGLTRVVGWRSVFKPRRQPEQKKQAGVQEEVESDDRPV